MHHFIMVIVKLISISLWATLGAFLLGAGYAAAEVAGNARSVKASHLIEDLILFVSGVLLMTSAIYMLMSQAIPYYLILEG